MSEQDKKLQGSAEGAVEQNELAREAPEQETPGQEMPERQAPSSPDASDAVESPDTADAPGELDAADAADVSGELDAADAPESPSAKESMSDLADKATAAKATHADAHAAAQAAGLNKNDHEDDDDWYSDFGAVIWTLVVIAVVCVGVWVATLVDDEDAYTNQGVFIEETYYQQPYKDFKGYGDKYAYGGKSGNIDKSSSANGATK
jgi:hypothetical protein